MKIEFRKLCHEIEIEDLMPKVAIRITPKVHTQLELEPLGELIWRIKFFVVYRIQWLEQVYRLMSRDRYREKMEIKMEEMLTIYFNSVRTI